MIGSKIKTYDFKVDLKNIINDKKNDIMLKPFDITLGKIHILASKDSNYRRRMYYILEVT